MRILVLGGAGAMGSVLVRLLARNPAVGEVVAADRLVDRVRMLVSEIGVSRVSAEYVDVRDHRGLVNLMRGFDVVVNCLPYTFNLDVTRAAIEAGVNGLDLGDLHETFKQIELYDKAAKDAGVTFIPGCGLAPGITNVLARYAANKLDKVDEIHIRGGSPTPQEKGEEFKPKFAYSPLAYIEDFTKDILIFENGEYKAVPPGSGREVVRLPYFGTEVEMYYTLHGEVATLPRTIKGVKTVTVRLTYSIEYVKMFKLFQYLNLTSEKPIRVGDVEVRPIDVLVELLNPHRMEKADRIWMVEVIGEKNGARVRYMPYVVVLDRPELKATGLAYGTASSAEIGALMLARGEVREKGVVPPEMAFDPNRFISELIKRGIMVYEIYEVMRKLEG